MPRDFLTFNEEEDKIHIDTDIKDSDKRPNFWYCYKIPIIIVIVVMICLGIILYFISSKTEADYNIAILSETSYPIDTIRQLETDIAQKGDDLNGDGTVLVHIDQYTISLNYDRYVNGEELNTTSSETDMIEQMNNISNFNSDVENYKSMIYLVDDYSLKSCLDQISNVFSYTDGRTPQEGATDYQNLGEKWTNFCYLDSLQLNTTTTNEEGNTDIIDESSMFDNLYICMRDVSAVQTEQSKMDYYNASVKLKNAFKDI